MLLLSAPALGEVEFYMTADRNKVGTEDTFRVEVVVANAPDGATVRFPASADFEVLSRSESTQMSYTVSAGGAGVIKQVRKYTIVMRANRVGRLTLPAATLQSARKEWHTEAVTLDVVAGRTQRAPPPRQNQSPFGFPPMPGLDDDPFDQGGDPFDEPPIPRSNSDLFLRASVDKNVVYVGEQVTYRLYIYSRVDLSSVDAVTMPKLEGFWTSDIKSPTQLSPTQKVIKGVPYREYLVREKALFALKASTLSIDAAEADIVTGFLFAGHKVHRVGNALAVKARPLPPGGKTTLVGKWRLSSEVAQTDVNLGDPIQLKLRLEGRGNLQAVQLPALEVPRSFKQFDPQVADKTSVQKGLVGGSRTVEYVLVPQQTGTFELPAMSLPYFNPETSQYEETRTDAITLTVRPAPTGQQVLTLPTAPVTVDPTQRNQLVAGGTKSLRHTARFEAPRQPLWQHPFFLVALGAPAALSLLGAAFGLARSTLTKDSPERRRQQQAKQARRRLAGARKLMSKGSPADFYQEVEKALTSFLEARLSTPVAGLTRPEVDALMAAQGVVELERKRVLAVFETCDMGRYAPGMGEVSARQRALDDAARAMEDWT